MIRASIQPIGRGRDITVDGPMHTQLTRGFVDGETTPEASRHSSISTLIGAWLDEPERVPPADQQFLVVIVGSVPASRRASVIGHAVGCLSCLAALAVFREVWGEVDDRERVEIAAKWRAGIL